MAILFYEIAFIVYLLAVGGISGSGDGGGRQAAGCLTHLILGPVVQGVLMGLLIAFLLPTILGFGGTTPISGIIEGFGPIAIAGIIAVVVSIVVSFIPMVGAFISQSAGIQSFVIGLVILRLFSGGVIEEGLNAAGKVGASVYPSLWLTLGYLAIASALVYGTMILFAFAATTVEQYSELLTVVVGPAFGLLGGLLPLFMYGQYVGMALRAAL